jgi:ABC-type multidrug transport system fused ATPase/permease subunit
MTFLEQFRLFNRIIKLKDKSSWVYLFFLLIIALSLDALSVSALIPLVSVFLNFESFINLEIFSNFSFIRNIQNKNYILLIFLFLFLIVILIKTIYLIYFAYYIRKFQLEFSVTTQKLLLKRYLFEEEKFFYKKNSSLLINNVNKEVDVCAIYFVFPFINLIVDFSSLIVVLIFLLYFNFYTTIIISFFAVFFVFIYLKYFTIKINYWGKARIENDRSKLKFLTEGLDGIREIKIFRKQNYFLDLFNIYNRKAGIYSLYQNFLEQVPRLCFELFSVFGVVIIFVIFIILGFQTVDIISNMAIYFFAILRILPIFNKLVIGHQRINFGYNSSILIEKEILESKNISIKNEKIYYSNSPDSFTFQNLKLVNVSFSYPDNKKLILNNINFELKKNDFIGILGSSGSGKSTLINIILKILEPTNGTIFYNDQNYIDRQLWFSKVALVSQNVFLFDNSIANNISFNDPNLDLKKLNKSMDYACIREFVESLPQKKETLVGQRGVNLSGGQKQRLSIARALYADPEILILDEATSAVDKDTEIKLLESIKQINNNKTVIIISHSNSFIKDCKSIYKLENGYLKKENN